MDKVKLVIDNVEFSVEEGNTILETVLGAGIYVPHLCHHPDLKPAGICRLCGVEVEGRGLVMSCNTPVQEGMVIHTNKPQVISVRCSWQAIPKIAFPVQQI